MLGKLAALKVPPENYGHLGDKQSRQVPKSFSEDSRSHKCHGGRPGPGSRDFRWYRFALVACPGRDSDCIDEEREEVSQGAAYATDAATRSTSFVSRLAPMSGAALLRPQWLRAQLSLLPSRAAYGVAGGWALQKVGAQISPCEQS